MGIWVIQSLALVAALAYFVVQIVRVRTGRVAPAPALSRYGLASLTVILVALPAARWLRHPPLGVDGVRAAAVWIQLVVGVGIAAALTSQGWVTRTRGTSIH